MKALFALALLALAQSGAASSWEVGGGAGAAVARAPAMDLTLRFGYMPVRYLTLSLVGYGVFGSTGADYKGYGGAGDVSGYGGYAAYPELRAQFGTYWQPNGSLGIGI
jgi:hypothetical protein